MSLLQEYKDLENTRQEEAKKSNAHYLSVDLPGTRTMSTDGSAARDRIAEMAKVKALPNHIVE